MSIRPHFRKSRRIPFSLREKSLTVNLIRGWREAPDEGARGRMQHRVIFSPCIRVTALAVGRSGRAAERRRAGTGEGLDMATFLPVAVPRRSEPRMARRRRSLTMSQRDKRRAAFLRNFLQQFLYMKSKSR